MENLTALDIGHGINNYPPSKGVPGLPEHEFNAAVGIELKKLLDHNNIPNFFTQQPNQLDTPLRQRSDLANTKKAKLLVSIHANGSSNPNVRGSCVFYVSQAGKRFADILNKYRKENNIDLHGNGLHLSVRNTWTDLHMVRETDMPAALTENGFMTNAEDLKLLKSTQYRNLVAELHAKAICEYFDITFKPLDPPTHDPHAWKYAGVTYLHEHGLLNDLSGWSNKIDEDMPVWATTLILANIHKDLKK